MSTSVNPLNPALFPSDVNVIKLASKLPQVGTTILTVMSAMAAEKGAVNLGQGFPDFGCDPKLLQAVTDAMFTTNPLRLLGR